MATVHAAFCCSLITHITDPSQKAVSWSLDYPPCRKGQSEPTFLSGEQLKLRTGPKVLLFTLLSLLHDPEMKRCFKKYKAYILNPTYSGERRIPPRVQISLYFP